MRFQDLNINDIFHTGKVLPRRAIDCIKWEEYKKIDKSHAICVKQVGYHNQRAVGNVNPFVANSRVFIINQEG